MKSSEHPLIDWLLGIHTMEKIYYLQQEILKTADETHNAVDVLSQAYEMLTDEQKITFILAGGVPSLFHYQQHSVLQMRTSSDTETGQLPVLC